MSRCKACDKILNTVEISLKEYDGKDGDMCVSCISIAFTKYSILTDKQYQHHDLDDDIPRGCE